MFPRNKKKRILVADDDSKFRGVTSAILTSAGFKVDAVETAVSGLKEMKKCRYDLLILDIDLPGNTATKLFQVLKKSGEFSEIPIFITLGTKTFKELKSEMREAVELADGYMQKPFQSSAFLATIRALLERKEVRAKPQPAESKLSQGEVIFGYREKNVNPNNQ
jgi:DNA-binding response OmpR family regulator